MESLSVSRTTAYSAEQPQSPRSQLGLLPLLPEQMEMLNPVGEFPRSPLQSRLPTSTAKLHPLQSEPSPELLALPQSTESPLLLQIPGFPCSPGHP